jgi:Ca2+-transporting ATPase
MPEHRSTGTSAGVHPIHLAVKGRARLRIDGLRRNEALKRTLEDSLNGGIFLGVSASTLTGTVLVHFDPGVDPTEIIARVTLLLVSGVPDRYEGSAHKGRDSAPPWHALDIDEVFRRLDASPMGLHEAEAAERLRQHGPNTIPPIRGRGALEILLQQFQSLPVALLGVGAVLSAATGGILDAVAIVTVIGLNAAIGFTTETKSERTIGALTGGDAGTARALRDGTAREVAISDLVPGDMLDLLPGMILPADGRVISADGLSVNEAALTGESAPVDKDADAPLVERTLLANRVNMVYRGTVVTSGTGRAMIVASGAGTEIGRIQALVDLSTAPETPMQRELDRLGRQLAWASVALCGVYFLLGLLRGQPGLALLKGTVSLAVAAMPEGLPTLATTTLALGIEDLRRHKVLIRRLDAVEGLSAIQVVYFDKTGTLTQSRMAVVRAVTAVSRYRFNGSVVLSEDSGDRADIRAERDLAQLLEMGVLCSEAEFDDAAPGNGIAGSATEASLIHAALDAGIDAAALRRHHPRLAISHRAEGRRYMTTGHRDAAGRVLTAMKGSPDDVLARCGWIVEAGEPRPMTDADRAAILRENAAMAAQALRVLGAAFAVSDTLDPDEAPQLTWVGLIALADPVRPEAATAIEVLHGAGIGTCILTGDQAATAAAVARELGLEGPEATPLEASGRPVSRVIARVTPAGKLKVIRELQDWGLVVAMVGDGVNDTPSLRAADIGIALGGGTDAALQTADVILVGDDLRGLVTAIERGRATHDNIRRALRYLLATNMSEIVLMLGVVATGLGQPLTPTQLLWVNVVTDVLPALGLSFELPEKNLMSRPPRSPTQPIIEPSEFGKLSRDAVLIAGSGLLAQVYGGLRYGASKRAGAVGFAGLVAGQLLYALRCRSRPDGTAPEERESNPWFGRALGTSAAIQLAALLLPGFRRLFGGPIGLMDMAVALGSGALPLLFTRSPPGEETNSTTAHPPTQSRS